ncbi:MAG: 50S ribosomal protein L32 [Candidatus Moranbacteria bacterium CG_4_10_14_3_um_filter_44_15]|nr:MAG: 50S ribosomal protein L32 [Candidatus Moranbacteria bacterium CG06_land_8_20_14_3_00_43_56]PIV84532.1 MAG: 50S ribosomal protein L32 [Candidatus Moranbacteria bacterium CG17_big_fil_post_rev_8_21_14_2_50_44_12]PIW93161.1 MAG: 50S ribosomal protein L32 [Candidatus Moranbacteria bacterium CG_4_8_14_3_um_filter_43_15]PIX90788.1 MAG: 50S ribosomal protein L32 [Candidatus Moranbacteria bacterium CG_4_10_14_3_um_filter_44_15]PJA86252.1 MAG: 50S ribosomal protein L32 [Candidatus Moranbacteria 
MSVPKQRHTKGRRNRRRANIKISSKNLIVCSHCSKMIVKHRICPHCGYYKGKKLVEIKTKKKKGKAGKEKKKE